MLLSSRNKNTLDKQSQINTHFQAICHSSEFQQKPWKGNAKLATRADKDLNKTFI